MSTKKNRQGPPTKWTMNLESVQIDLRRAIIGGIIAAIVIMMGGWLTGRITAWQGYELFKAALPSTRSFCGTISLALGNILALMLTLLSLSASMEYDIKWSHYQRVRQISWIVTITLIGTVICYLLMNIPVAQSDNKQIEWFIYVYYVLLIISSVIGGAFITIALLLYNTVRDIIEMMHPDNERWQRQVKKE